MSLIRSLALLAEELIEAIDATLQRPETAACRWLRRLENRIASAGLRLRVRRLEAEFDRLRAAACRRAADALIRHHAAQPWRPAEFPELDHICKLLAAARKRLEECSP